MSKQEHFRLLAVLLRESVAFDIQNRVKTAVEGMTGLKVVAVNVHVQGVNTEASNRRKKEDNTENEVKE